MKHIFTSQSNFDMGRNRYHRRLEAKLDNICPNIRDCPIEKTEEKCRNYKSCRVYKFYKKYTLKMQDKGALEK